MSNRWHAAVDGEVERMADRLRDVATALHADPELAFAEHRAADRLCAELAGGGFAVERGTAGMPTAFVGRAGTGDRPRVAFLLEYDALPGLGHTCGHNLIAAAASTRGHAAMLGAARALAGTGGRRGDPARHGGVDVGGVQPAGRFGRLTARRFGRTVERLGG